jgi:colanic acid biosynthesis glycosyl transferase WcaI
MKLLLVNRHFGHPQVPTGRMLADVAQELAARGHTVTVFTTLSSYAGPQAGDKTRGGLRIHYAWSLKEHYRLLNWVLFLIQALIVALVSEWERCLILTDPPFLGLCAVAGTRFGFAPRQVYWWTMDLYPESLSAAGLVRTGGVIDRALRQINEITLRHTNAVICLDSAQVRRLTEYRWFRSSPRFCRVIPPWDDRPIGMAMRKDNRFLIKYGLLGVRIALYAGNLGEAHCYSDILAAARLLSQEGRTDWRIVFVTRGAKRKQLEAAASEVPSILVLDYQPPELTADLLSAADVHLLTMSPGWEGIVVPSKLYGMLKTGRPILFIGPDNCGTAQEITSSGAGVILTPDSPPGVIVEMLDRLCASPTQFPTDNSYARITEVADYLTEGVKPKSDRAYPLVPQSHERATTI